MFGVREGEEEAGFTEHDFWIGDNLIPQFPKISIFEHGPPIFALEQPHANATLLYYGEILPKDSTSYDIKPRCVT